MLTQPSFSVSRKSVLVQLLLCIYVGSIVDRLVQETISTSTTKSCGGKINFFFVEAMESTSRFQVVIPKNLFEPSGGYEHREALFGVSPYGGSIQAKVYYINDTLCGNTYVDANKAYPNEFCSDKKQRNGECNAGSFESPFILMMNRGDCTFVQKVRNGQHAGAAGVLIADTTCLCGDESCMEDVCETQEPIMADDGSGSDISIPSFLLYKRDADIFIQDYLSQQIPMLVDMSWSMPQPDGRVEYDLWTTPVNFVSLPFILNFKRIAKKLGSVAYFTPHMFIYDGTRVGCQGTNGTSACFNLCTNGGRYCATDPDDDVSTGISGADVVKESLRRLCIWEIYGTSNGIGEEWWTYAEQHYDLCRDFPYFSDPECIGVSYIKAKIDRDLVERCMIDSGDPDGPSANNKLDNEIEEGMRRGVVILPTADVNGASIRGALNIGNVFKAICSGFLLGTAPPVCQLCSNCLDITECIDNNYCKTSSTTSSSSYSASSATTYAGSTYSFGTQGGRMSYLSFVFTMLLLVGVLSSVSLVYYKRSQDEMRNHVRDVLAEYMPLQDDSNPLQPQQPSLSSFFHNQHNIIRNMAGTNMDGHKGPTNHTYHNTQYNMDGHNGPPQYHHQQPQQQQFQVQQQQQYQQPQYQQQQTPMNADTMTTSLVSSS